MSRGRTRLWSGAVPVLALAMGCTEKNLVENNGEPNLTPSFAIGVSSSDFQQCANGKTGLDDCTVALPSSAGETSCGVERRHQCRNLVLVVEG